MKKLINDPRTVVREMLEGIARQAPHVAILGSENVLVRRGLPIPSERTVALISGGGSGHEPAHGGYVGNGMLSAAVCGEVFTSPSTDAVLAAIHATCGESGALLIVKNYTGDRLNFGLAAELARSEGVQVEIVTVADDVSLRGRVERDHRRGIAGTVLIHKIAGAAAAQGYSLDQVAAIARRAIGNLGTMGVALNGCTLPGAEGRGFHLADNEIELGLGIHGEKGVERVAPTQAYELTETLLKNIIEDLELKDGERVALMVNGLGATPEMELSIVLKDAFESLNRRRITVERAWAGTFLSALDMPGCSITLLRVDDEMLALLDANTDARAWPGSGVVNHQICIESAVNVPDLNTTTANLDDEHNWMGRIRPALQGVALALLEKEAILTDLDSKAGDGDLGASMRRAAEAILAIPSAALVAPDKALAALAMALRRAIAGSSGPFYATALIRAARKLSDKPNPTAQDWGLAMASAADAIGELGGAKPGDRTMLDALVPAVVAFESGIKSGQDFRIAWEDAVSAAESGAESTSQMTPCVGRASYLGGRAIGSPDGGAVAVACWLRALQPYIVTR